MATTKRPLRDVFTKHAFCKVPFEDDRIECFHVYIAEMLPLLILQGR